MLLWLVLYISCHWLTGLCRQVKVVRRITPSLVEHVLTPQPTLFDHFRIESNANNEIWLEINLDALLRVLKSADSSSRV
jgi:hypothetical protein